MFNAAFEIIEFIIGKGLDAAGKLRELQPTMRRQAAQAIISFYEDLGKFKIAAEYVEEELGCIIEYHRKGEYNLHHIEGYISIVNEANNQTMEILRHIFLEYTPHIVPSARGVHTYNVIRFLEIMDPKLCEAIGELLGNKLENIYALINCFDLIYKEQADKSLRTLEYITDINFRRIQKSEWAAHMPLNELKKEGIIKTRVLDSSNIHELVVFNEKVRVFIDKVDATREKIRNLIVDNFKIDEIF